MTASARSSGPTYATFRSCLPYLALIALLFAPRLFAHDIPADVLLQVLVKPDGQHLHVLVRAPMAAMRDVEFPLVGPGYLKLDKLDSLLTQAVSVWITPSLGIFEGDDRLPAPRIVATRVSLPSDKSFASYDEALAHIHGPPVPLDTELYWNQAVVDVELEYAIASDQSHFSVDPTFARLGLRTVTALRFVRPDGSITAFELVGDPGLVRIDPAWYQAAARFVSLGFEHILSGTDHLLFLLCLIIPVRQVRQLVIIVTSFTVAHSITLIASAFGLAPDALWFPPLVEALIAVSIVYMALENIVIATGAAPGGAAQSAARFLQHRWLITFAFGLVHGFGFSFALRQTLQFAGSHLLTSLLSFNLGVELGQLLVLALTLPLLAVLFRYVVAERVGIVILSALVGHTAWHWMTDRIEALGAYTGPTLDAAFWLVVVRILMAAALIAGLVWLIRAASARRAHQEQMDARD